MLITVQDLEQPRQLPSHVRIGITTEYAQLLNPASFHCNPDRLGTGEFP